MALTHLIGNPFFIIYLLSLFDFIFHYLHIQLLPHLCCTCLGTNTLAWTATLYTALRFIHSDMNMASLIHPFIRPLSLPLLTGRILRGLPLELLPCAFYPLLSHTHTHACMHIYLPPHFLTLAKDFMSVFAERERERGIKMISRIMLIIWFDYYSAN